MEIGRIERVSEQLTSSVSAMKEVIATLRGDDYLKVAEAWNGHIAALAEREQFYLEILHLYADGIDCGAAEDLMDVDFSKGYLT